MKTYFSIEFDSIYKAIEACDKNQDWNVINIYPTGWRHEVCVVYYTTEQDKVMKANEAPERIWINSPQDLPCGIVDSNSIEYVQTDAFIKKSEKYLKSQFIKDVSVLAGGVVHINFEMAIENFVNYMKGK